MNKSLTIKSGFVSKPRYSLWGGSHSSAVTQSLYSIAPADWLLSVVILVWSFNSFSKANKPSLTGYFKQLMGDVKKITFPRTLGWNETQKVLFRYWTRVVDFNYFDKNRYAKHVEKQVYAREFKRCKQRRWSSTSHKYTNPSTVPSA